MFMAILKITSNSNLKLKFCVAVVVGGRVVDTVLSALQPKEKYLNFFKKKYGPIPGHFCLFSFFSNSNNNFNNTN